MTLPPLGGIRILVLVNHVYRNTPSGYGGRPLFVDNIYRRGSLPLVTVRYEENHEYAPLHPNTRPERQI